MIIANPIYDVVFKYLLEDIEIARELLSSILGEEIISLQVKPQETAVENPNSNISVMRFDFKAVIKTSDGATKKVLIELQKVKQMFDVMRFRRYLGDNYRREDDVLHNSGTMEKRPLPIITIYFLGFPLDNIQRGIVKINREYRDVVTQEIIDVKEDFVELLTHDSYLIQLRLLAGKSRTKLERILRIFSPEFQTEDPHQLNFRGELDEPLVKRMVDRLGRAMASDEIREIMDVEDEIDRIFERGIRKVTAEKDKIIAEKEQEIEAKAKALEAHAQALEVHAQALEAEKLKSEALLKELDALKQQKKQ